MLYDENEINRIALRDAEKQGLEQGLEQGLKQGKEQGLKQGEKSATKKIVFRMLKKRQSDKDIIEIAEISANELSKLKAEYAGV